MLTRTAVACPLSAVVLAGCRRPPFSRQPMCGGSSALRRAGPPPGGGRDELGSVPRVAAAPFARGGGCAGAFQRYGGRVRSPERSGMNWIRSRGGGRLAAGLGLALAVGPQSARSAAAAPPP